MGLNAGTLADTRGCSQVPGDSALDQQANETHRAGNQWFRGPMELSSPKINEFFCFDMECPSVKITRRLQQL